MFFYHQMSSIQQYKSISKQCRNKICELPYKQLIIIDFCRRLSPTGHTPSPVSDTPPACNSVRAAQSPQRRLALSGLKFPGPLLPSILVRMLLLLLLVTSTL